ncbi:hypothetical protein K438DRAFT_1926990 [Mycena galopus ATCC 62051]|nr:hypothetical protein K438DRAFT_1926990 [Mycena galopus ATCC 62051]
MQQAPGPAQARRLLAEFYADLDPAGVPTVEEIESGRGDAKVTRGFLALLRLTDQHLKVLSPDVYPAFWPRVWAWFQFVDTYSDCFPDLEFLHPDHRYTPLFTIVSAMLNDARTAAMIESTPGVRYVLARGWAGILERPASFLEVHTQISHIIRIHFKVHNPQNHAEIVDGVGGISDLAQVLVKHIDICPPPPPQFMSAKTMDLAVQAIQLMNDMARVTPGLNDALVSHAVVTALVWILRGVDFKVVTKKDVTICLGTLMRFLTDYPDVRLVVEALDVALLACIARSLDRNFELVRDVLTNFLPAYTLYYSVLAQIQRHNADLHSYLYPLDAPGAVPSPLRAAWSAFADLVTERLRIKTSFDIELECQNIRCTEDYIQSQLKVCSACLSRCYCSLECQARDWRKGHRTDCSSERGRRLDDLRTKDRLFLPELLFTDMKTGLKEIRSKQVEFSLTTPAPFYTSFNYLSGRPAVTVLPASKLGEVWADDVKRMKNGEIEVYEMVFLHGNAERSVVFPLPITPPGHCSFAGGAITRMVNAAINVEELNSWLKRT